MRIALITTIYGRMDLTNLVLDYYVDLSHRLSGGGIFLNIYAAISPEDDTEINDLNRKHYERSGVIFVEHDNEPLTDKWNAVSRRAHADRPDLLIVFGSDDFLNETFIRLVAALIQYGHDAITSSSCYFYDPPSRRMTLLRDARVGAGRAFSLRLMDELSGNLWSPGSHISPDQTQNQYIQSNGRVFHYVNLEDHAIHSPNSETLPMILDVKTTLNRWKFSDFTPERNPAVTEIPSKDYLFAQFPEAFARSLWDFAYPKGQAPNEPCKSPGSLTETPTS